jgi:hypothetical protein
MPPESRGLLVAGVKFLAVVPAFTVLLWVGHLAPLSMIACAGFCATSYYFLSDNRTSTDGDNL